jgi:hypothetical protein
MQIAEPAKACALASRKVVSQLPLVDGLLRKVQSLWNAETITSVEWIAAGLAVTLCLSMHVVVFDRSGGLWRDEASSVGMANKTWSEQYRLSGFDSFPMGWLALVRGWTAIAGQSDESLRFLGLIGGCLLVVSFCTSARQLGFGFPFIALVCCAINPGFVYWGDSIRAYGFGGAVVVLLAGAFWRLGQSVNWLTVTTSLLLSLAAVSLQHTNCFLVGAVAAAACVIALRRHRRPETIAILGVAGLAALSTVLQINALRMRLTYVHPLNASNIVSWSDLWETFAQTLGAGQPFMVWIWIGILCVAIGFATLLQFLRRRKAVDFRSTDLALYALLVILISTAAEMLFLKHFDQVPKTSYYFSLLSLTAVMIEACFQPLLRAFLSVRAFRALGSLAMVIALTPTSWADVHLHHSNIEGLCDFLHQNATPGDLVVVQPWFLTLTVDRYYHGPAPWIGVPDWPDKSINRYDEVMKMEASADPCGPALDRIGATLANHHSVWIVGGLNVPPAGLLPPKLAAAPDPKVGWDWQAYVRAWSLQVGEYVQQHAQTATVLPQTNDLPLDGMEDVSLVRLTGTQ